MTSRIVDSSSSTIESSALDLSAKLQSFRKLDEDEAREHLGALWRALTRVNRLLREKPPQEGFDNSELIDFVRRLCHTMDALLFRDKLGALDANSDIWLSCSINPTDSGFPVFVRDLEFLRTDISEARDVLNCIPPDKELVDSAVFSLMRGVYPKDAVRLKLTRNYNDLLLSSAVPAPLHVDKARRVGVKGRQTLFTKLVERLDENGNVPRFYRICFKVPTSAVFGIEQDNGFDEEAGWLRLVNEAIVDGLSSVSRLELPYLANTIEAIEGVQLEMIERFDIGPFYGRFTANKDSWTGLFDASGDEAISLQRCVVQRVGEKPLKGIGKKVRGYFASDRSEGEFSPVIASPRFFLMPYRLVQRVYNEKLTLGKNIRMIGLTKEGDLID